MKSSLDLRRIAKPSNPSLYYKSHNVI